MLLCHTQQQRLVSVIVEGPEWPRSLRSVWKPPFRSLPRVAIETSCALRGLWVHEWSQVTCSTTSRRAVLWGGLLGGWRPSADFWVFPGIWLQSLLESQFILKSEKITGTHNAVSTLLSHISLNRRSKNRVKWKNNWKRVFTPSVRCVSWVSTMCYSLNWKLNKPKGNRYVPPCLGVSSSVKKNRHFMRKFLHSTYKQTQLSKVLKKKKKKSRLPMPHREFPF